MRDTVLRVLPSHARVQAALDEAAEDALRRAPDGRSAVLLGHRLTTFPGLAEAVYAEAPAPRSLFGNTARRLLAGEVVRGYLTGTRRYFSSQLPFRGFVDVLLGLFDDLGRARVTPERFREVLGAAATATPPAVQGDPRKYEELAALYAGYRDRLVACGGLDRPTMEAEARGLLLDPKQPIRFLEGVAEVEVSDLYDLTPVQFETLLAVVQRVGAARVTFPYNPERPDAYRFVGEHTLGWFEALGDAPVASAIDPCFRPPEERTGATLDHVLEHLFRGAGERPPPAPVDGTVRILAAPGPAREVEEIGREVRALLAAGTGPDAIGIVFRSLAVYGPLVEDAFRRMGIPTQFRRGSPVLAVPAVRALLALLEMAASPGSLEPDRVVSLCSSAYLDLEFPSPTGPVPAPALEATLAQAGVLPGTPAEWDRALARHVARLGRGRGARSARRRAQRLYADAVRRGVADLAAQLSALGSPRTPAGHAGAIRDAMRRFGFRRRVRSAAELPLRRRDGLALVAVDRILSEAEDAEACGAAPKRDLPLAGFLDLLARGLAEVSVPGEPAAGGGVRVLDAFDARGLRFDAVFVGGLVEGEFPVAHREPHLFTDEERELFRDERGRRLFRSTRLLQWEDPLLFCLALSSARREAILSYPTVDARGEAVLRSYFVEEVLRLLAAGDAPPGTVETERVREVPLSEIVPPLERATDRASVLASLFREMWRRPAAQADGPLAAALFASLRRRSAPAGTGAGAGDPDTCLRLARIETRRERFFGAAEPREREGLATPWTGLLDEGRLRAPLARRLLTGRKAVWSASHFEEYANCPFSFFMDRVLDLEAFVRPEVELSPAAVGTLAHAILETCFRDLHARGALPIVDRDAAQTALSRAAEQVFEHWEREENLGDPVFWELRKREVLAVLRGVVEREAELEAEDPSALPAHFEFPFGFGSGEIPDPVGVPMGEMGTVRLRGKIDRVDLGPDRLRVVDYKYSRSKEKFTDATSEARVGTRNFQLPLYLWVLGKHLEARGVLGASAQRQGGIFLLKEPDLLTATFPAALFGEPSGHGDDLPTRIGALLKRALDGRFDVTPHECPFWCEFRNACRYYLPLRGS